MIVIGPLPEAKAEGVAAGGEAEVVVLEGAKVGRRESRAANTGKVSIESGERPSGRVDDEVGIC